MYIYFLYLYEYLHYIPICFNIEKKKMNLIMHHGNQHGKLTLLFVHFFDFFPVLSLEINENNFTFILNPSTNDRHRQLKIII